MNVWLAYCVCVYVRVCLCVEGGENRVWIEAEYQDSLVIKRLKYSSM